MTEKVRVLSITRDDCEWTYTKSGGPGGQHRNKTATAVTVRHPPSGAVGHAADSKSQWQNRQKAWRRMAETPEFKHWLRMQSARTVIPGIDPSEIRVEVRKQGRWVESPTP